MVDKEICRDQQSDAEYRSKPRINLLIVFDKYEPNHIVPLHPESRQVVAEWCNHYEHEYSDVEWMIAYVSGNECGRRSDLVIDQYCVTYH